MVPYKIKTIAMIAITAMSKIGIFIIVRSGIGSGKRNSCQTISAIDATEPAVQ